MTTRYPAESKRAEKADEDRIFNCIDPQGIDAKTTTTMEHILNHCVPYISASLPHSSFDCSRLTQVAIRQIAEPKRAETVDQDRAFNCINPP